MKFLSGLLLSLVLGFGADSARADLVDSDGWSFAPVSESDQLKHKHQVGHLNETSKTPVFTTTPVLLIPVPGLSKRSKTAQLARLAKEVTGLVNRPIARKDHTSKKIADGQPRVEAEYGTAGKGLTWAFAAIDGDHVIVMMTQSRELKPPDFAREEFFKMARAFRPPASAASTSHQAP